MYKQLVFVLVTIFTSMTHAGLLHDLTRDGEYKLVKSILRKITDVDRRIREINSIENAQTILDIAIINKAPEFCNWLNESGGVIAEKWTLSDEICMHVIQHRSILSALETGQLENFLIHLENLVKSNRLLLRDEEEILPSIKLIMKDYKALKQFTKSTSRAATLFQEDIIMEHFACGGNYTKLNQKRYFKQVRALKQISNEIVLFYQVMNNRLSESGRACGAFLAMADMIDLMDAFRRNFSSLIFSLIQERVSLIVAINKHSSELEALVDDPTCNSLAINFRKADLTVTENK